MSKVYIEKVNEVMIRVRSEDYVEREIYEMFKFQVPQAKFVNRIRKTRWDGNIHLYSLQTKQIYAGLLPLIEQYCRENNLEIQHLSDFSPFSFSDEDADQFIKMVNITKQPRDYQIKAFKDCIRQRRGLIISPTGSGKSLLIYLLARFYSLNPNNKILIVVPTTGLVHQMAGDFQEYGYTKNVHRIVSGQTKTTTTTITISTWQSLQNVSKDWLNQFHCVLFDEAHLCKAKVLTSILKSMPSCKYRFGFTGTLDNVQVNQLLIQGLFYVQNKVISTHDLMQRKQLADLSVKIIVLEHPIEMKKTAKDFTYQQEIEYLIQSADRNKFISDLALSLEGNTLILYQRVGQHGQVLFDCIRPNRQNTFFIHGGIDGEVRNSVRMVVEQTSDSIIVASYGTFSTGISITNLHNIIFASPTKSKVRSLQSIGRGLRVSDKKGFATLYDIADNLTTGKKKNYTLSHLMERVKNYNEERFKYRVFNTKLNAQSANNP